MFARHVAVKLRPGALAEFTRVMDSEILPWLRTQKGFLDAITMATPGGSEIVSISFWDQEENAQAYSSKGYPEVLGILKKVLLGTPQVKTFNVVGSTLQKVDVPGAASSSLSTSSSSATSSSASASAVQGRQQRGDSVTRADRANRL
jgi:heme-degrading monooxygenase HmoA